MSTPLARILGDLAVSRATGRLAVTAGGAARDLYLKDGTLVQATSRLAGEALGSVMVDAGMLREDELGPFLEQAAEEGRQLGDVLIAAGRLSPLDVVDGLTLQVRRRAANCLRLETFVQRFHEGERPRWGIQVAVGVPGLIYEAAGDAVSVHRIRSILGLSEDIRFRLTVPPDEALSDVAAGPKAARRVRRLPSEPLGALISDADDENEVLALVFVLWALGRLELVGGIPTRTAAHDACAKGPGWHAPVTPGPVPKPAPGAPSQDRGAHRERLLRDLTRGARRAGASTRGRGASPADTVVELWLRMERLDYFALLGLSRDAGPSDVRIAYGGLLRRLHLESPPDDWPERAKAAAKDLRERASLAFAVLTDPHERVAYVTHLEERAATPYVPDALLLAGVAVRRAERLRAAGRLLEAAEGLRAALEEIPEEPALHLALGRTLREAAVTAGADTVDEAAVALATAARLDPALDQPWLQLGLLARHRGDDEDAAKMLRRALRVNPRNERAKVELDALEASGGILSKLLGR